MTDFDQDTLCDYIAAHGFGDPSDEGLELAFNMARQGDDYATIAHEVVFRGLTLGSDDDLDDGLYQRALDQAAEQ